MSTLRLQTKLPAQSALVSHSEHDEDCNTPGTSMMSAQTCAGSTQTAAVSQPSPKPPMLQVAPCGGMASGLGGLQPPPAQSSSPRQSPQEPPSATIKKQLPLIHSLLAKHAPPLGTGPPPVSPEVLVVLVVLVVPVAAPVPVVPVVDMLSSVSPEVCSPVTTAVSLPPVSLGITSSPVDPEVVAVAPGAGSLTLGEAHPNRHNGENSRNISVRPGSIFEYYHYSTWS